VFIELAEALDCPACGEGFGLVAFVRDSDRRRVLEGHLGCPLCELEFPIVRGAIDFRSGPPGDARGSVEPKSENSGEPSPDPEMTVRLVALLGLGERTGASILLGLGLAVYAPDVARLAERVEILAVLEAENDLADVAWGVDDLAAGADPVLGLGPGRWPIRSGALNGVALRGAPGEALDETWRCLRPEGRLVLVEAKALDTRPLLERGFETLAEDANAWVGRRP